MTEPDFRRNAPREVNDYYDSMPNNVRALYATFRSSLFPWRTKEIRIEAWGQLCFDDAANNAVAYHMHNKGMRTGWKYISWRCEMDDSPIGGGKLSGLAPTNFDIYDYVPKRTE